MKSKITLILFFSLISAEVISANCLDAYQQATYGLQHAEDAMASNNIEHLKLYTSRSKAALKKVMDATERCGCQDANNSTFDALVNIDRALVRKEFERGRFFVKNALVNVKAILVALDLCAEADPSYTLELDQDNLEAQEQLILEEQQKLLEKQRKLEQQLKEQKELQIKLREERAKKLEEQQKIKAEAETSLTALRIEINRIIGTLDCGKAELLAEKPISRSVKDLENESVKATKIYYAALAQEMSYHLLNALANCH